MGTFKPTKNTKLQVLVCYTHIYHLHAQAFYSKINAAQLFYFNELINIHTNVEEIDLYLINSKQQMGVEKF